MNLNSKTLRDWQNDGFGLLPENKTDVDHLLAFVLEVNRSYLYAHPDAMVPENLAVRLKEYFDRRKKGEPLAYITGTRSFWKYDFQVSPTVLIPRPETELLVETCLELISGETEEILELGTGSGAIAISLAKERPRWKIFACENSKAALEIAKINQRQLEAANLTFIRSHWFDKVPAMKFSAIVSNPPYVTAEEYQEAHSIHFEPKSALIATENGLSDLKWIIENSKNYLKTAGWLILEHGYQQKTAVHDLLKKNHYQKIHTKKDLAGHDRVSYAQFP